MAFDKLCPGSRAVREPIPECMDCPDCGSEVEIWTDELRATCPGCGNKISRVQQAASCIDWCSHAQECVGAEVYHRLRTGIEESLPATTHPVDIIKREHIRILDNLSLLRTSTLCLKLGTLSPRSAVLSRGIEHLAKALDLFDIDLSQHFQREEALFPMVEQHTGGSETTTQLLRDEHRKSWEYHRQLRQKLGELQEAQSDRHQDVIVKVGEATARLENLLQEHIKREDDSLVPLLQTLPWQEGQTEISQKKDT